MHTNGKIYGFNIFRRLGDLIRSIYYADILIKQAMNKQNEMETLARSLDAYKPQREDKEQSRDEMRTNFLMEDK